MTLHESKVSLLRLVSNRNGTKNGSGGNDHFYDESLFHRMFEMEIKRTKRSKKSFLLILIHLDLEKSRALDLLSKWQKAFSSDFRDTDIRGWYKQDSVVGVIFTDLTPFGHNAREVLFGKTMAVLNSQMAPDELQKIYITFHSYPRHIENDLGSGRFTVEAQHGIASQDATRIAPSRLRKLVNYVLSLLALIR
jgi:hypothetical protein